MRGLLRAGVVLAALCSATPALASDFSGIGRAFWWGIGAIAVLIAIPVVLVRRKGKPGSLEGSLILAVLGAVMLAPAILIRDYDQWLFIPFPATAIAALEGSLAVLFPVPLVSMLVSGAALFWLLDRGRTGGDGGGR